MITIAVFCSILSCSQAQCAKNIETDVKVHIFVVFVNVMFSFITS